VKIEEAALAVLVLAALGSTEMSVIKHGLALLLPALAILGASFAQYLLTLVWPEIQRLPSVVVSIDSYLVNLLTFGLCVLAGRWTRRNTGTRAGAALMTIAPLAFVALNFWIISRGWGSVAWLRPFTIFIIVTAVLPLVGVALGWWRGAVKE
jgi:hypothetical protein